MKKDTVSQVVFLDEAMKVRTRAGIMESDSHVVFIFLIV
jgi:hypothetical protein